ncbi:hypothetical protein GCM10011289_23950 [Paludibacterium paludis]|uniref:Uncharacterized protein n=1 Tax=Paludibacterium paludis TaxID=1225769 RepID=A0A918P3Z6_9NEIS|nr:hypothetical protein GCM10011289_23950 [Paludibacterium paludis]
MLTINDLVASFDGTCYYDGTKKVFLFLTHYSFVYIGKECLHVLRLPCEGTLIRWHSESPCLQDITDSIKLNVNFLNL